MAPDRQSSPTPPARAGVGLFGARPRTSIFIALTAAAFLIRLPFALHHNLSPDAVDYIDISRNIAEGRGVLQGIKWHFFTNEPAPHSAWGERPVLLPALMAPLVAVFDSLIVLQLFNALLGALGVAMLYLWARAMDASEPAALWLAGLMAVNPASIMCSVYVWTEPLFLVLLAGVFLALAPRCEEGFPSLRRCVLAGALGALAFYARPTGILLLPAVGGWMALRRQWRALATFLGAMVVLMVPYYAMVGMAHGSPFYSVQGQHLRVGSIHDAMAQGYGQLIPSAGAFIASQPSAVASAVSAHLMAYTKEMISLPFFGVLSFFLVGALVYPYNRKRYAPAILFAVLHFLAVGVVWAAPVDANRFLLVPLFCLLPPSLEALGTWRWAGQGAPGASRRSATALAALASVALIYVTLDSRLYRGVRDNSRPRPATPEFVAFVDELPSDAVLAAAEPPGPFIANFLYRRPTIILPEPASADRIRRFARSYRPTFLLGPPGLEGPLAPLINEGLLGKPFRPPESPFLWWPVAPRKP